MNWNDYVRGLIKKPSCFDRMLLSFGDDAQLQVPPIVKASVLILEHIINTQSIHNVIVFPEKIQTSVLFLIMKTIYDIINGKTGYSYDPYKFTKGQKLKYENCVMEFDSIEKSDNGKELIHVKLADIRYGLPIELAPYFQITNTRRPLSKFEVLRRYLNIKNSENSDMNTSDIVRFLLNYKTHIKSTVFYVTVVTGAKELIKSININNRSVDEILLIGQADYKGQIKNAMSGQMSGIPAITLSPDLFSVVEAISRGIEVQSIILDISSNMLNVQLDALDQLCRQKYPVVFLTDMEGSLDLRMLSDRGFNIWRWNEDSITKDLYEFSNTIIDRKTRNCANSVIEYCTAKSAEICDSLKLLYKHREDVKLQSPIVASIYGSLFEYTLIALRSITPVGPERIQKVKNELEECRDKLIDEKRYISDELYENLQFVVNNLLQVYSSDFTFPKINLLLSKITEGNYKKINIIISEKEDKNNVLIYWKNKLDENGIIADIEILYPDEFIGHYSLDSDITVITGWFNKQAMQRILFSYNAEKYLILLYEYENKWKNAHASMWRDSYNKDENKDIVKKSLGKEIHYVIKDYIVSEQDTLHQDHFTDDMEEIDLILREHKYRKYISNHETETIEAIPVGFAGGFFAFFTPTRKLITVTEIIVNRAKKISIKPANELNVGDFIVIRETQKDLIREIADLILTASGKEQCRQKASEWRDALTIEAVFCEFDDLYDRLYSAGCTKDKLTVKRWLNDEDTIIPQDKSDLIAIATALNDSELLEKTDEIYAAGRTVMSAHIKAGRVISEKLRRCIADEIYLKQRIDPYNIYHLIPLYIDDVGKVNVLKITDINKEPVIIEAGNANKLIKEVHLWQG